MGTLKRAGLVITSCVLIVAMIAVWLFLDLGTAADVAAIIGAVAGVAMFAYALLSGDRGTMALEAEDTGKATTKDGNPNTGIRADKSVRGSAKATRTGEADTEKGNPNTGISQV